MSINDDKMIEEREKYFVMHNDELLCFENIWEAAWNAAIECYKTSIAKPVTSDQFLKSYINPPNDLDIYYGKIYDV